ncbi:pH-signaling protein PalC [Aspergillus saccharolyticus JOP 1030-1]|uniref:pH-response regulator protein palC n=1 Tax=Aspergillus saccharolyticus JOP 1030-1 TaxID=1450539 RepID=A0A318ZMT0_9EURO|nr:hypothetical protein BP01DRAFT_334404 [Aspergillus saccharolyticus JOP 1030-1]PYH47985.1 hypothetical protein BP01DRAFT_334404 [Aspergillus saccharolyticus JOP 1030-1]
MVYAFTLPTTSHLSFQNFISSSTHPSLPQAATTARHALRQALKAHKRLPRGPQQDAHLSIVLTALTTYLPYLEAISSGLSSTPTDATSEEVEITLHSEIVTFWRPTLTPAPSTTLSFKHLPTSPSSGRNNTGNSNSSSSNSSNRHRIRGEGIDFETAHVLTTLGYVLSLLAHTGLMRTLYASTTPTNEQRTAAVQTATKHLLHASAIHNLLASSPAFATAARAIATAASTSSLTPQPTNPAPAPSLPDLDPGTQTALSALALAEATLLAVLKDDSYVFACIQARNPKDKDWMVRAPEIPKVRAHLFARLCIRAAEYAEQAAAGLGSVVGAGKSGRKAGAIEEELLGYTRVLARVARARACRFFGVDAELAGRIGEAIAWLQAAKGALGVRPGRGEERDAAGAGAGSKSSGGSKFSRFKQGFREKLEEKKMEKDAGAYGGGSGDKMELGPGDNAGRDEEGRVIEMLETKWVRMNNTINTQLIPPSADLLANLPSGRDIHSPPGAYRIPALDEEQLVRMRAPPAEDEFGPGSDEESEDEPAVAGVGVSRVYTPGSVPGRTDSAYY